MPKIPDQKNLKEYGFILVIVSKDSVHHSRDSIVKECMSHYDIDDVERKDASTRLAFSVSPFYCIIASNPWGGATHIQNLSCSFS